MTKAKQFETVWRLTALLSVMALSLGIVMALENKMDETRMPTHTIVKYSHLDGTPGLVRWSGR